MKENKWYTLFNFLLPTLYVMVLGLFFAEETPHVGEMGGRRGRRRSGGGCRRGC